MSLRTQQLLDSNIDFKSRTIFLFGDIEDDMTAFLLKTLWGLDKESKKPINLIINSLGGYVYDTFAIYDMMTTLRCPIFTHTIGTCQSAAVLLAAFGKRRTSTPSCQFMMHDMQLSPEESVSTLNAQKAEIILNDSINQHFNKLLAKHSFLTLTTIQRMCEKSGNFYFDALKAKEYGIIDFITPNHKGKP